MHTARQIKMRQGLGRRIPAGAVTSGFAWCLGWLRDHTPKQTRTGMALYEVSPLMREEPARLAVVRGLGLLDTAPEKRLDRLVELASFVFETPMAAISLVDENRLWFKARVGLHVSEVPRTDAFCAMTIRSRGPLIVLDAAADRRFAGSAMVVRPPGIRFYAGAPIVTREGAAIGSLCVLGDRPRPHFGNEDARILLEIAAMAIDQIELIRRSAGA